MISPALSSRIVKRFSLARLDIDAYKIGTFVDIAADTCPAQIVVTVVTAMLSRDDVLDMKGPFIGIIGQSTILAAPAGPASDEFASPFAHRLVAMFGEITAGLGLKQRD